MPVPPRKTRVTERRNARSLGLDRLSTRAILQAMNREDARVVPAVRREIRPIARAVDAIVQALKNGGRLFYVGAGTSGRLAVLDAAECPPTFGISPRLVQAIIAGGRRALTDAAEGDEDSAAQGARDLARKKLSSRDVVVGITASGGTPYVLGALRQARRKRATTVGITSNPRSLLARAVHISIGPDAGPEILAGSTRLKAGTVQKMVLNMLSTAAMIRLGRVYDNWMIDVALTNRKLRARGLRILTEASGRPPSISRHALRQSGHNLRVALVMLKKNVGVKEARNLLRGARGDLRRAFGE
ncbi:MAG: N-acetylmuramic acid 6-phosphate etherase [Candidatus Acidiferrales bacterium]